MKEVICNHEVTCDFCGRDFPVPDVKTNDHEHLNGGRTHGIFNNGKNYIKTE